MNTKTIIDLETKYSIAGFKKRPIAIVKGKGSKVWDADGNEYIDCIAGQGSCNIGHCNEKVIKAVKEQLNKLMISPPMVHNDKRAQLLEKLCKISTFKKAFLCNSGTEAVEAALKFSRVTTKKTEIIAAMNSFHGRTMGALSATWKKNYREPFDPLVPGFSFVPYNNIEKLRAKITDNTAAIILEVVQGEGGIIPADQDYLNEVRELCSEKNIILIFDEVQTGFGRTGELFAWQNYNVKPDMMTVAKSIAGGIPMGAVLCNEKIEVPDKLHANTFGGYPIACAAALATIEVLEKDNLAKKAKELGQYFYSKLKEIDSPKIREIRVIGLMVGIELKEKPAPYIKQLMESGILAFPAGLTVLRFLPTLVISKEEIDTICDKLKEILE
jgi:LysW-gamma-L-lysine/LysW-L-ornithine aminotransferase